MTHQVNLKAEALASGDIACEERPMVAAPLSEDDLRMVRAFRAWEADHPTCSPTRHQIEKGYGLFAFARVTSRLVGGKWSIKPDTSGPKTFRRLVELGVIEHSRSGRCWLSEAGKAVSA